MGIPYPEAMRLIFNFLVNVAAVALTAYLLAGVSLNGFVSAVLVTIVLGIFNLIVKPVLNILAFPINLLTFGLFSIVLNGILILIAARLVPGFTVANFWWAIIFSIVLAIVNFVLHIFKSEPE